MRKTECFSVCVCASPLPFSFERSLFPPPTISARILLFYFEFCEPSRDPRIRYLILISSYLPTPRRAEDPRAVACTVSYTMPQALRLNGISHGMRWSTRCGSWNCAGRHSTNYIRTLTRRMQGSCKRPAPPSRSAAGAAAAPKPKARARHPIRMPPRTRCY